MYTPRYHNEQEGHVDPAEGSKLLLEVASLERQYEANKTHSIESETDHAMIHSEWGILGTGEYNMLLRNVIRCNSRRKS